jgi:RNA polymerase sigma-70 factor (ECF subfamily)
LIPGFWQKFKEIPERGKRLPVHRGGEGVNAHVLAMTGRDRAPNRPATVSMVLEDFDQFYLREFKALVAIAASVAGDTRMAEDLTQEALLKVHARWETASQYRNPGTYARRIVINLALNRRRRLGRETRALLRLGRERTAAYFDGEGHEELWSAVAELAPQQRAAVTLRYLEGHSAAEIADILDCTESTARGHLFKARQSLAQKLGEPEPVGDDGGTSPVHARETKPLEEDR